LRQYIVVFLIVFVITTPHVIHTRTTTSVPPEKSHVDLTPPATPILFGEIEHALARISFDLDKGLQLNQKTASSLSIAVAAAPDEIDSNEQQHISFLIQKSFPGNHGRQLTSLFINFYDYKLAEARLLDNRHSDWGIQDEYNWLDQQEALQNKYLGKHTSSQLYNAQRALARHLLHDREKHLRQIEAPSRSPDDVESNRE